MEHKILAMEARQLHTTMNYTITQKLIKNMDIEIIFTYLCKLLL